VTGIEAAGSGNDWGMSDTGDTPTDLREDVQHEVEALQEEAAAEERARMAEREAEGVDEPNDEVAQPDQ